MTVKGGKSLRRRLRNLKDELHDEVVDAAEDGLDSTEKRAKRKIVENDAVGSPAAEMFHSFVQSKGPIVKDRGRGTRLTLTNTSDHAPYQEWGTGGHFGEANHWGFGQPPVPFKAPDFSFELIAAISTWIAFKPGFRRAGPDQGKAIPIARSIAYGSQKGGDPLPGTPAQPFMRPAWFFGKNQVRANATLAVKQTLRRA